MIESPFLSMFDLVGLFYGVLVPLVIIQLVILFLIPSLIKGNAKTEEIGKAIYCFLSEGLGLILMTVGGLPTLYSVLAQSPLHDTQYVALLLVFATGGLTYLWHDHVLKSVSATARCVPHTIYFFAIKFLSHAMVLFAALSLLLKATLVESDFEPHWWVMHTIVLLYGLILWWCTRTNLETTSSSFRSTPLKVPIMKIIERNPLKKSKKKTRK
ncbi:hypothetical protein A2635_04410 [Candidatus Peribacteria bacterium RIFCSPHIGHO2_01_FULL_51_9]|nr:MAG: hypothetical protein A2635_04410 [Candidatus Peribacteria bacterium RIFCSPHIGHO2_01_FULL_51_9]